MSSYIINGVQLPAFDVDMLTTGKLIAVPFKQNIKEGKAFWLYPSQFLPENLTLEQYYRPEYLEAAKYSLHRCAVYPLTLTAWGRCEQHWRINLEHKHLLYKIVSSLIWNLSALEHIFEQHQVLKLLILRVYMLSQPCLVNQPPEPGNFYWPQSEDVPTTGRESDIPVVSEASFKKRRAFLLSGQSNPNAKLEDLQAQVANLAITNPNAKQLDEKIKIFLGWSSDKSVKQLAPDLAWINDIAALGDRSQEHEQKKSNYQAGTDFENIVRNSLQFLGFTVEEAYKGGAGGLDLFCSKPYPLIVECKAGKSIPGHSVYELDKLGDIHLDSENLATVVKLIIGPGKATSQLQTVAQKRNISIINPMTLQKLIELQANYPNSVNLIELKPYLQAGQIDYRIEEYVQKVLRDIKLRSQIIQAVKELAEKRNRERVTATEVCIQHTGSNLTDEQVHELLIELSSPLTGYLGRTKGNDGSDRFYFLRDLPID